jgi:hypothetical protein
VPCALSDLTKIDTCVVFIIYIYIFLYSRWRTENMWEILLWPLLKIRTNIHDQRFLDPVSYIFDTNFFVCIGNIFTLTFIYLISKKNTKNKYCVITNIHTHQSTTTWSTRWACNMACLIGKGHGAWQVRNDKQLMTTICIQWRHGSGVMRKWRLPFVVNGDGSGLLS